MGLINDKDIFIFGLIIKEREKMGIDHVSLSTTKIILNNGDEPISQGTGFFYYRQEKKYGVLCLVTNYHVLTGHSPMSNNPPIGDNICFQFHLSGQETGRVKTVRLPLFTIYQKPIWLTSSICPEADLAIVPLPIALFGDCPVHSISKEFERPADLLIVRPAMSITLVGYPYGHYDKKNSLPIWKTGSIASEPNVDFEGKPSFMVDASIFPGMSGSPAFTISPTWETEKGQIVGGANVKKFMGILASIWIEEEKKYIEEIMSKTRSGIKDEISLEIGVIWKASLISELVYSFDVDKYRAEISNNVKWKILNSDIP